MDSLTDLYLSLAIGLCLTLLVSEFRQVMPAGLIVPGYMALMVPHPISFLLIFATGLLTFVLVKYVLARYIIIYGRRKFTLMLLVGFFSKLSLEGLLLLSFWMVGWNETQFVIDAWWSSFGVIIPGLMANMMERQGARLTVGITLLLTFATFGLLLLIKWLIGI